MPTDSPASSAGGPAAEPATASAAGPAQRGRGRRGAHGGRQSRGRAEDAAQRWHQALALAAGRPTPAGEAAQRRARTARLGLLAGVFVVTLLAGVLVGLLAPSGGGSAGSSGEQVAPWLEDVSFSVVSVGFVVEVVGLVALVRARQWGAAWKTPMAALTWSQRRAVNRQIAGRTPVVGEHLPVLVAHAERVVASRWLVLMLGGLMLMFAGQLVDATDTVEHTFTLVAAAFEVVAVVSVVVLVRRAQRFLRRSGR